MKFSFELDLRTILRWLLGIIFVWAALSKIANPQNFYADLVAYRLPIAVVVLRSAAIILPWLELLCGFLLVSGFRLPAALVWILLLSLVFVIATGQAWARGLHISCGCLDLRLIGLDENSGIARLVESPAFAFFRALLLGAAAAYLFTHHIPSRANENGEAATS
jgi:uncharacterized membrane protein YphA (DoxX/SURF4 family)